MGKGARTRFYADIMSFHPEVTGSGHLVVVKNPNGETNKFMVDFGLFQEKAHNDNNSKLWCNPENLDAVLVTHNHVDHIGRLPYLVKNGFTKSIFMTTETSKFIKLALEDSCEVLKDVAKRNNVQPLYTTQDVQKTLEKVVNCKYKSTIQVQDNIKVTFLKNGHLSGAALILVQISYPEYEDINILFTGDYNAKNMFFDVEELPEWVRNLKLTIVQEATYGTINSKKVENCFENNVSKAIQEKKTIVVPVFSLGRSQEILYVIKKMQTEGKISKSIPIYFDGNLAFRYTNIYLKDDIGIKEEMKDFLPENLVYVDKESRQSILEDNNTKIIVTTSGMGSYGPAQIYIPYYVQKRNALIHFTGYTAEGTLGRKLQDTPEGEVLEISGLMLVKRAEVKQTMEYSAHAKADEMIDFLKQFTNLKLVLVNHGQTEVKKEFSNRILKEVDTKYVGILGEGYLFRVDPYGLVKTMSTKFE